MFVLGKSVLADRTAVKAMNPVRKQRAAVRLSLAEDKGVGQICLLLNLRTNR